MTRSGRTLLLLALGNAAVGTGMYVFLGPLGAIARDLDLSVGASHAFYGTLNAAQWVRFLVIHADHHMQISEAIADRTGRQRPPR